jgi:hypothetical protein
LLILVRTLSLFVISFSICYRFESFLGNYCKSCVNSFSANPKIAPLVLLINALYSSKDLIPLKSNFMVKFDISFKILEIFKELTSSSKSLLLIFWSKSFMRDLNSRILTLSFYSAFAKCNILFKFFDSVTFSAIS